MQPAGVERIGGLRGARGALCAASGQVVALVLDVLHLMPVALASFVRDRCIQWAAALAYYTLIGLVPLLVSLFSFIKACGFHRGLTPFIMRTIGAGSPEVSAQIVRFIDRTNVSAVGVLSSLGAVLAVFAILGNAELCFNTIWGNIPGRPLFRKARAFMGVAMATPIMLVTALAGTTFLRRDTVAWNFFEQFYLGGVLLFLLRLIPYGLLWVSLTMMYTVLPHRSVRVRSAVIGAIVAGTIWEFAQWGYVTFVIKLVRYSAFYGALWQLPILLAWVYVAWSIVLLGAEVCRVHQENSEGQVSGDESQVSESEFRTRQPSPEAPLLPSADNLGSPQLRNH